MASIKDIRKRGIWMIAALSLIVLLILNVLQLQYRTRLVVISSFVALSIWLIIMGIWRIIIERKIKRYP